MQDPRNSGRLGGRYPKTLHFLAWLLVGAVLLAIALVYYSSSGDPRCAAILAHPDSDVVVPLPENCTLAADIPADEMTEYLQGERKRRGLIFKGWITCNPSSQAQAHDFGFTHDPRWLPSYVPNSYQLRRTVIILPYANPVPQGSPVVAEICLIPRQRYVSQLAGQCDGKFSTWR